MRGSNHVKIGLMLVLLIACYIFTVRQSRRYRHLWSAPAGSDPSRLPNTIASSMGVYAGSNHAEHDIIVLSANYGYLDFLVNWVCTSGNVLNLKYLVVAQDEQLYAHLRNSTDLPVLDGQQLGVSGSAGEAWFATEGFNQISVMKLKAVIAILRQLLLSFPPHGHAAPHVLFSDVDIVWKRDPFPYLRRDVDLEIQNDNQHGRAEFNPGDDLCTGFYYMRASNRTIDLLERSLDPRRNDQKNVHVTLDALFAAGSAVYVPRNAKAPGAEDSRLSFRQLPPLSFPNGAVLGSPGYEQRRAAAGADLVIVHANWIQGTAVC